MIIFRNGVWIDSAPVKLHRFSQEAGFVIIGSAAASILLKGDEVAELHRLLDSLLNGDITKLAASDCSPKGGTKT